MYGISHSHFSGGRVEWTEVDRHKAIAYERYLNLVCKQCGSMHSDWFDDDDTPLEEPHLEAVIKICEGCVAVANANRGIDEGMHGAYVTLVTFGTADVLTPDEEEDMP